MRCSPPSASAAASATLNPILSAACPGILFLSLAMEKGSHGKHAEFTCNPHFAHEHTTPAQLSALLWGGGRPPVRRVRSIKPDRRAICRERLLLAERAMPYRCIPSGAPL
jgi:hypothetical protein